MTDVSAIELVLQQIEPAEQRIITNWNPMSFVAE